MKLLALLLFGALPVLIACSQQGFLFPSSANGANSAGVGTLNGANVLNVQVGNCGVIGYPNEPCATVTLCIPGTTQCQTISDILVDTGSYGFRVFSQVLTLSLPHENDSSGHPVVECGYFGSANDWGPVEVADLQMGGEKASSVPIQVIDSTFGKYPTSSCSSPQTSPAVAGFNGILGVGLFKEDCGEGCASSSEYSTYQVYYSCTSSSSSATCTNIPFALSEQVANPVAFLPQDNNGVILQLPAVSSAGAVSVSGSLIFGIGTQSNNTLSGVTTFAADDEAYFSTLFSESPYSTGYTGGSESFIDSGSNGIFFPSTSFTQCTSSVGFYCPTSAVSLTATQEGSNGVSLKTVSFQITNADAAFSANNPNFVFNNLGGTSTDGFDWGLPFFLGRTIAVGLVGTSSSLGTGPYWAY